MSELNYGVPIEHVYFLNYFVMEYANGIQSCEFPIYVVTPEFESSPGEMQIPVEVPFELKSEQIAGFTVEESVVALTIINERTNEEDCVYLPYIAFVFKDAPYILYCCLLYPWDPFIKYVSRRDMIIDYVLALHPYNEADDAPPYCITVKGNENWSIIYDALKLNTRQYTLEELRYLLTKYGYKHISLFLKEQNG